MNGFCSVTNKLNISGGQKREAEAVALKGPSSAGFNLSPTGFALACVSDDFSLEPLAA
jgi:hypothetical protein